MAYEQVLSQDIDSEVVLPMIPTSQEAIIKSSHSQQQFARLYRLSAVNVVVLLLQVLLLMWHVIHVTETPSEEHHTESFVQRAYGSNEKYMTLDHDYDFLWQDLPSQKAGVIGVSKDVHGEVQKIGAISMFHQLHCLVSLRTALQDAYEGGKVAFDFNENKHWPHCLYYLRQMILCTADGQIEGQRVWNGTAPFIDGSGDLRQCKNPVPLYKLFKEKRVQ